MKSSIVVYTAAGCGFCKKQKEWLAKYSIEYEEKDVEIEEYRQELLARKALGVPYTVINIEGEPNEVTVAGFNVNKLESFLLEDQG